MKNLIILFIQAYQVILSPIVRNALGISRICKYEVSCSAYAKKTIEKRGVIEGLKLSTLRILSCQSFVKITI